MSYDTLGGGISFFIVYIYLDGSVPREIGSDILPTIAVVSSTLFAIVLTGFTIITSFTDRYFLYAWKEVGDFDGVVTLFQYNLALPIIVILASVSLIINYNGVGMMILISLFVYMILSLLNLVGFISKYSLQRAEFVKQQMEKSAKQSPKNQDDDPTLSTKQLKKVKNLLTEYPDE
ncbi:MAG: hypothetical protein U5K70_03420 [Halodesulfurarchaeum sp.]|nr:hypothetical protein [Halodesulfurarchaeum sp.]